MVTRYNIDKNELIRLHQEEKYSIDQLAAHWGCSTETIRDRLKRWRISRRSAHNDVIVIATPASGPNVCICAKCSRQFRAAAGEALCNVCRPAHGHTLRRSETGCAAGMCAG